MLHYPSVPPLSVAIRADIFRKRQTIERFPTLAMASQLEWGRLETLTTLRRRLQEVRKEVLFVSQALS